MGEVRTCPVCKEDKTPDDFYKTFRKERKTYRYSYSCKTCDVANSKQRLDAKKQANKDCVLAQGRKGRQTAVSKLNEGYVAQLAAISMELSVKEVREVPGLLDVFKNRVLVKRKIKEHGCEE